jgi:ubiquitin-conjugating enzyme E2 G2
MLAEPNVDSPASVEAAKMYRLDRPQYNQMVKKLVQKSLGF